MSMSDLLKAFDLIEQNESESDFDGEKPESLLRKAEEALGVTLPATYRLFLSRQGCGSIAGEEFYGVITADFENSSVPDAIWLTLNERKSSQLPRGLVLIGATGDGGYYAIDRSQVAADGESPIVEWWAGPRTAKKVANDFGEFLLRRIRAAIGTE